MLITMIAKTRGRAHINITQIALILGPFAFVPTVATIPNGAARTVTIDVGLDEAMLASVVGIVGVNFGRRAHFFAKALVAN